MPSAWMPLPVLPSDSGLRWVKTCMRVELNQHEERLVGLVLAVDEVLGRGEELLVHRRHALGVERAGVLDLAVRGWT